jgi:DNA mismatch repair protein MutL
VEVNTETEIVSIRGFVVKPENATRKAEQYFFVNGRYMRHPYFLKAVMTAYSGMLTNDYQPSFFIYFDINPEAIDVNIHPTKTEIKFADEQTIFQILMASVREALGKFAIPTSLDFDAPNIEIPLPTDKPVNRPQVVVDPNYNPFHTRSTVYPDKAPKNWETLYEGLQHTENRNSGGFGEQTDILQAEYLENCPLWQYGGKYILVPTENGIVLINQHRAHIAVLRAQFIEQLGTMQGVKQQLLFPEVLELPQDEMILTNQLLPDLRAIGFDMEQLSPDSYSIQGIPAQLANQAPVPVLQHILTQVRDRNADTQREWREQIAQSMAESTAIPYGKTLSETEMRDIVTKLVLLPQYRRLEDGKIIVSILTDEEINKRF